MYDELINRLREAAEKSMCGECGLNLHMGATKKGVLFADAADAIEELQKPKWISVKERLPKLTFRRQWYLVSLASGCVETLAFDRDRNCWWETGSPVTHWMPLPEPPKEET